MKTFNLKYMMGLFLVLFMVGCKDDADSPANVEEGLPATLNISIQVPEVDDVTMSRSITENESQIERLALFCYSVNSNLKYCVDLTNSIQAGTAGQEGYRGYNVNGAVQVQTGTFTIYAVANWDSKFASQAGLGTESGTMPEESDLKAMMATNSNVMMLRQDEYLPMSEIITDKTFYAEESGTTNTLELKLERTTAHIEFIFQDGDALKDVNGHFTPQAYMVYNLPQNSYLFNQENNQIADVTTFNIGPTDFENGSASFEFWMNENVQSAGTDIDEYTDRDAYNGNNWRTHSFTNAPSKSTFVVVRGEYEDNTQNATVDYLIHLGDFSDGDYTNFTVNRNEYHKYTVTINGINSVSTQAKVINPGAYSEDKGDKVLEFVDADQPQIADAHYVMYPVKIKTDHLLGSTWTVEVDNPDNHQWVTLKKESDLSELQKLGYWTSNELGGRSVSGDDTNNGEQTIYVFMEENAARNAQKRDVTLNLYKTDFQDVKEALTITQLPVNWNGNLGNERIEDGQYPWGFNWERRVEYESIGVIGPSVMSMVAQFLKDAYSANFITIDWYAVYASIVIDYSGLNALGNLASSEIQGLKNTQELYNYQGVGSLSDFETTLDSWRSWLSTKRVTDGEMENVQEFAAKMCALKNKFEATEQTYQTEEGPVTYPVPVLHDDDFKWYLPAVNEYSLINDEAYPLNGTYWTSSAASDNTHAKTFTTSNSQGTGARMDLHPVRAARVSD